MIESTGSRREAASTLLNLPDFGVIVTDDDDVGLPGSAPPAVSGPSVCERKPPVGELGDRQAGPPVDQLGPFPRQ